MAISDGAGGVAAIDVAGLAAAAASASTQTVSTGQALSDAIHLVDELSQDLALTGASAAFTIDISGDIALTANLEAVALGAGSSLTIDGGGNTLDGGGAYAGFFAYSGALTIADLTIAHAIAQGGAGGPAAGGGAGLGGGLFVAGTVTDAAGAVVSTGASVTLSDVAFTGDAAAGGAGGQR